jgi:hypothetical protein
MWEGRDLWSEILSGRKTSEWRDFSKYWQERLLLCHDLKALSNRSIDYTKDLKVHRAWFVVAYPKGSLPRLEAEITGLVYHPDTSQLEIKFTNAKEVFER